MPHRASSVSLSADPPLWRTVWKLAVCSPVLWGLAATWAFYQAIPHLPRSRALAERYFCGHQLEYVLVGLFFIGLAILVGRALHLVRERRSLSNRLLVDVSEAAGPESGWSERITLLEVALMGVPGRLQHTLLMTRCRDAVEFIRTRQSVRGLEQHLKELADDAADRLHDSYSLLLTINWAVPIIGFLGTVVGITLAIANVTPEQLDTSLNHVTGGLGVAFDTTTVALSFSLVLVFTYDWIRRLELRHLSRVEQLSLQQLLPLFLSDAVDADPLQRAQTEAARKLLDRTEALIHDQTSLWRDSMEGLRQRWSETIGLQQRQLSNTLHQGMESTITDHAGQLAAVRREFLDAFESAARQFEQALQGDAARRDEQESLALNRQQELWTRIELGLQEVVRAQDAKTEELLDGLSDRMQQWQAVLERSAQSVQSQLQTMAGLAQQLARLGDQGEQLTKLERQLSDNLGAVRAAETFEETLHNLTAAVHILTARARQKAA